MSNPQDDDTNRARLAPELADDAGWNLLARSLHQRSDEEMARSEAAGMSAEHGLQNLMSRIDTQAPAETTSTLPTEEQPSPGEGAPWWIVRTQTAAIVALAASLAVVALWLPSLQGPTIGYETYSDQQGPAPSTQLRVVFNPDTSLAELRSLLQSIDAQVSAGPTSGGVFDLSLAGADDRAVEVALESLRADDRVVFAEPVTDARGSGDGNDGRP
ncbi:MAG: hypothetical protein AAGA68_07610 [Pseudomonadota bacterium]